MKTAKLELLVWVLIYGGGGLAMLGLWSLQRQPVLAQALIGVGVLLALVGVLLIWVRSRMRSKPEPGSD